MTGIRTAAQSVAALAALWLTTPTTQAQLSRPVPGKLETYRNWTIGCDNGGRCQAASLTPTDAQDWDDNATIFITRDGGSPAEAEVRFLLQSSHRGVIDIMINDLRVASTQAQEDELRLNGAQALNLIRGLAHGRKLELQSAGKPIAQASLNGSYTALRYMDARQGRAGTVTALVAAGPLSASVVRTPPALPVIHYAPVPLGKGAPLWQTERTAAYNLARCPDTSNPNIDADVYRLDRGRELVLLPCGAGAYNFTSVPLIASGLLGRRSFAFARFDYLPSQNASTTRPTLVNAGWDAKTATLGSYAKSRGLGDCGNSESYVWDGYMFRLTQATAMGECRGAWTWITLYRARSMPKQ